MDWRTKRITEELRKLDKTLFAVRTNTGMVQVWRKAESWKAADVLESEADVSSPTQFIFALTSDWTVRGTPEDVGLLPITQKVLEMDSWQKESLVEELRKCRERAKELRERAYKNEIKARAYDMRKEFAQATNDINAASL